MKPKAESLRELLSARPEPVRLDQRPPVRSAFVEHTHGKIVLFQAERSGPDLHRWTDDNRALIEETFRQYGAILFRGFANANQDIFGQLARKLSDQLMDYSEPSTPRTRVARHLYTSTEYPKEQSIPPHNEHSYSHEWPTKIWFYCATPARVGGQTPIADGRKVYELVDPQVRQMFAARGIMYVRNFGQHLDLKWQEVFQTNDRKVVEEYCRKASITFEWGADGNLRTRQVGQAVIAHPRTGETVWFNQAHLFHVSNLDSEVQAFLLERFGQENLPRNSYFGDGTAIDAQMLVEIRNAYKQAQIVFDWQAHDILMLDNILYAHGRKSFEGQRRVLVAMADSMASRKKLSPEPPSSTQAGLRKARRQTALHFAGSFDQAQSHEMLKYKVAAACRIMVAAGLDEGGISGHISFRVPDEPECFWLNPFGLLAEEVTPENLIKVDRDGTILEGEHPANVAGFCIHSAIHSARPDVNCVVHTHSPWGTLFSALGRLIDPIDQNCCMFFENHAIHTEYQGPVNNSDEVSRLVESLGEKDVLILSNHGTITCGSTIQSATMLMVAIERAYRLNLLTLQADAFKLIPPEIARRTRDWIANPMGLAVEFDALLRKVERLYPEFKSFKPHLMTQD